MNNSLYSPGSCTDYHLVQFWSHCIHSSPFRLGSLIHYSLHCIPLFLNWKKIIFLTARDSKHGEHLGWRNKSNQQLNNNQAFFSSQLTVLMTSISFSWRNLSDHLVVTVQTVQTVQRFSKKVLMREKWGSIITRKHHFLSAGSSPGKNITPSWSSAKFLNQFKCICRLQMPPRVFKACSPQRSQVSVMFPPGGQWDHQNPSRPVSEQ